MTKLLSTKAVATNLKNTVGWSLNKKCNQITKIFKTGSFVESLALAAKIAVHAEILNHHPVLELSYGSLKVTLTTHDADGLTKDDFELAKRINNLKI